MKKLVLLSSIAAALVILACNKTTTLAPVTTKPIFSVAGKMAHAKDTLAAAGDTIWLTASGSIADTSRKYAIAANLKTADSTNHTIAVLWIRNVPVTFNNAAPDSTGMFKWTTTMALPFPAIPAKNKLTTTAVFSYGLNLSSQMGNLNSSDSKITYVK
jgi:hypothetical protein